MINIEMLERFEKIDSEIVILCSKTCKIKALELNKILEDMLLYYKQYLNKSISMRLICLSQDDYKEFSNIPYGMPFVFGTSNEWFISMPGEEGGVIEHLVASQMSAKNLVFKSKYSNEYRQQAIGEYVNLIGYHEVGHIISHELGLSLQDLNFWLYELIATYLCYIYLKDKSYKKAGIWTEMCDLFLEQPDENKYTTLDEFNTNYSLIVGNHPINYQWYQSKFNQIAVILAEKYSVDFFFSLKEELLKNKGEGIAMQQVICNRFPEFREWLSEF